MRLRPILAPKKTLVVAQQQSPEALTKLFVDEFEVAARAAQVADRFVFRRGRPDRGELAGAIEPSQGQPVAPIGLDAIAGFARGHRRRDQVAIVFGVTNLPANAVAAGAGFVAEVQPLARRGECGNQATDSFGLVVDFAVEMRLGPPRRGDGDRDAVFVNVHPDVFVVTVELVRLFHDLSSSMRLCASVEA